jgi:hypothetical protein
MTFLSRGSLAVAAIPGQWRPRQQDGVTREVRHAGAGYVRSSAAACQRHLG